MNCVPRSPNVFGVSRIGLHDVPKSSGRRSIHKCSSVELNSTHVFTSNPDMNMRRLEAVLPSIDNESELAFYGHRGHFESLEKALVSILSATSNVSYNDTHREVLLSQESQFITSNMQHELSVSTTDRIPRFTTRRVYAHIKVDIPDADPNRALLDHRLVCDLLGFDENVYEGIRRLPAKWCAEPSVYVGKARAKAAQLVI